MFLLNTNISRCYLKIGKISYCSKGGYSSEYDNYLVRRIFAGKELNGIVVLCFVDGLWLCGMRKGLTSYDS